MGTYLDQSHMSYRRFTIESRRAEPMMSLRGSAANLDSRNVTPNKQQHESERQVKQNHTRLDHIHTHVPRSPAHRMGRMSPSLCRIRSFRSRKSGHSRLESRTTANQEPSTIIIIPRSRQAQANELIKCSLDYSGSCSDSPAPTPLLATSEGWRDLSQKSSRVDGRYHVCCSRKS